MKINFSGSLLVGIFLSWLQRSGPAQTLKPQTETLSLMPGKVIRLEKSSLIDCFEVRAGVVWLTGSPAGGDVLVSVGERFALPDHGPFIIEALAQSELALHYELPSSEKHPIYRRDSSVNHYVSMC